MLEIVVVKLELFGIGFDENIVIVVCGDCFEVIGEGYVVIYDVWCKFCVDGGFYFFSFGDVFDLVMRILFW